ncbi:YlmH/Sll1252 family protein [Clostridium sp. SHJSY1]|uniref:YlmH family RNA-binding protein n=1 Tax=Clostridium sp. SHJSY1 TaxID=2942483 RepID=UPI00287684A8|nr:YlmH/Sll1252 family protein [Clostridium sp. SHJSY1]MDS0527311.1 YlmH/Sll1252 family protein [Clostridium sp. SHJSY1]
MDKQVLLKNFGDDDRTEVLNLYEKYIMAKERDIPLFGNNFYSPNVWKFFEKSLGSKEFSISSNGYFEDSERRMIAFNNIYEIPFPFKMIKITNSSKFSTLSHRDFLGALLALGIKRTKIGDLLVNDNCCYFPVCEEISDFVIENLKSVGKSPCNVAILPNDFIPPVVQFLEMVILVQSLRVDAIISKIAKVSRDKAQKMINEGKVLIDYNLVKSKSLEIQTGERITIRGFGKFILGDILGNSKSGKFRVAIKKYT